tara:strand:+ start:185 stop:442 length:258 start_codon:yes stop_codon:yes gene_type:complete
MIKINNLPQHIPYQIKLIIQKLSAINIIQKKTKEYFIKKYGVNWKDIINYKWTVEELDLYCERKGIMDPWYDYCDDPRYDYKTNN